MEGIFCGYTDDDLTTVIVFTIKSKRIKCCAYDNCRWVYGNLPWKLTNPSASWDSWKDAASSDDSEEDSDSETTEPESSGAEELDQNQHGIDESPQELSGSERGRELETGANSGEAEPIDENWSDLETEEELELKDEAEKMHLDSAAEHPRTSSRAKARSDKSQANYEMYMNKELDKAEKSKRDRKKSKEKEAKKISEREARREARTAKLSAHLAVGGSQERTQTQNEALKAKTPARNKYSGTGQVWRNAHRAKNPLSSQDSDFEKVSILLTTTKPTLDAFMKPQNQGDECWLAPSRKLISKRKRQKSKLISRTKPGN